LGETSKILRIVLLVLLGVGGLVLGIRALLSPTGGHVTETPVEVVEVDPRVDGVWSVPRDVVDQQPGIPKPFVLRLKNLRAERLKVEVAAEADGSVELRSSNLKVGDLLILRSSEVRAGQAVAAKTGIDDERLIHLTLEAGMEAAMAEDLDESMRFISVNYSDNLGYKRTSMRKLLERAYKEFDEPVITLDEPPEINIREGQAIVSAKVRLSAVYGGRRNYLLGDTETPNHLSVQLSKSDYSWKVFAIEGLRPLGLEEELLRLLGEDLGLELTESEREEKERTCMPCRQRMSERFGSGS
jgi:hypothetical protein